MRLGLHVPDFTWPNGPAMLGPDLARVVRTAEDAGFHLVTVMDHFFQIRGVGPAEHEMLEAYTTLGYIAAQTSRINIGTLVTGAFYRHPGILVKQVTTLNVLSGGRAWFGVGAGWNEQESRGLGVPFPPLKTRFEILEETLKICLQMWKGDESPYKGKHFQLERPLNSPQPITKPRPTILIGGSGERKTLKLVARYADACNIFNSPELAHKLDVLRAHCEAEGRDYDSIMKTTVLSIDVSSEGGIDATIKQLEKLAAMGFEMATVSVKNVGTFAPLEVIGRRIIPAISEF